MSDILLSVKPRYAEKIFDGTKVVEYRRILPKNIKKGDEVFIYESSPVCRVVGSSIVNHIEKARLLDTLWDLTKDIGGISENEFYSYFNNKLNANAIYLCKARKFDIPKKLSDFGIKRAPQSFLYLNT